jgi:hypothetical protein
MCGGHPHTPGRGMPLHPQDMEGAGMEMCGGHPPGRGMSLHPPVPPNGVYCLNSAPISFPNCLAILACTFATSWSVRVRSA